MSEFRKRLAGKLSGGMKQKLGLVCALIHRPKVILLDEPTTGVDPVSRRDFWRILYELTAEGVAILTSTAYLDEAERCHRVALLHQGKLLFCDTPDNLKVEAWERRAGGHLVRPAPTARANCEHAEGISSLVLTGDGLHIVVDDAARRIPEFEARLKQRASSVRRDPPGHPHDRRSFRGCRYQRQRRSRADEHREPARSWSRTW